MSFNPKPDNSSGISTSGDSQIYDQEDISTDLECKLFPFDFKFTIPANWSVETIEIGGDPPSQKCLTHNIPNPGGFANLEIVPMR